MKFATLKHDILYGVVSLILGSLIYSALPERSFLPQGVLMPMQKNEILLPGPSHDIPILTDYPLNAQAIGNINITMALPNSTETTMNSNLEQCKNKAKALAEAAGAQAVIIIKAAHYNKTMGLNSTVLYAQALLLSQTQ